MRAPSKNFLPMKFERDKQTICPLDRPPGGDGWISPPQGKPNSLPHTAREGGGVGTGAAAISARVAAADATVIGSVPRPLSASSARAVVTPGVRQGCRSPRRSQCQAQ
jgi:hypothetical protein